MAVLDQILARASRCKRRIVFPEADDPRTIGAVARLARDGIVEPVLLDCGADLDRSSLPDTVEIVRPGGHDGHAAVVAAAEQARGERGDGAELIDDPLHYAAAYVRAGWAAGMFKASKL